MRTLFACVSMLWLAVAHTAPAALAGELRMDRIRLPKGFKIEVFARGLEGARSLALSPGGTLFVGTRGEGKVYAIPSAAKGETRVLTVAKGLREPNGVAFRDGALYVAEVSRILRFDGIEKRLEKPPAPVVVTSAYPKEGHHGWKFIAFGPDGKLYVPVGAPCNVCDKEGDDERFASITRLKPDGSGLEIVARGVRNSVGFDWNPETRELWFTDNGRDRMGDDIPPDELNRVVRGGEHYGFPFCHAGDIADPDHGKGKGCGGTRFRPPEIRLGPHVAALGMRFYTGKMFPAEYRGQVFIAEHGSWNRTQPLGYRISLVRLKGGKAVSYETFAEGWLQDGSAWGRPVDVIVAPDGALFVSDDQAGVIYRISTSPKV